MSLPIILNTPTYEVELPLSKLTVKYRPYLVKEEKLLMMAMESQDQKMIMKTVQDIIEACTFGEVKAKNLPTAELELMFLKLRTKSVGETTNVGYECKSCGTKNELSINLEAVTLNQDKVVDSKIMLTDTVGVIMKFPTSDDVAKVLNSKDGEVKNTFAIINSCIEAIFDDNGVYEAANLDKKEVETFVESLNSQQFQKIQAFFEGIPRLSHDASFDCEKCGAHNNLVIEGLQAFFA
jgi:DNA-directed RNA polymerase subunit M/transcription elongation factor TFIIS